MARTVTACARATVPQADPFDDPTWRTIHDRLADPHPFASPAWQRAWWTHFGHGRLAVLTLGSPSAAAALGVAAVRIDSGGVARFLGDEATTDYPGPVIAPGRVDDAAGALLDALRADSSPATVLEARDLRDADGLAGALARAAARTGLPADVADDEPVALLSLPREAETWRAGLSRHSRRELARKRRRFAEAVPGATVRTTTPETLARDLDAYCALHRRARGEKSRYLSPPREAFVRAVCAATLADGTLRLDTLQDATGRPLAVTLGFSGPRTFSLYNMAFDPDARAHAPGIVLVARLVERAIAEGLSTFDFLRGLERYKLELGAVPQMLRRVRVALR